MWADYGTDFYAARTWRNEDDARTHRTTWLGWMGNWNYARQAPSAWGKGFESVPRDITLQTFVEGIRLVQKPVEELKQLRRDSVVFSNKLVRGVNKMTEFKPSANVYELEASFDTKNASILGFNLLVGNGRKLIVGYDTKARQLFIDRTNCTDFTTDSVFNKHFPVKVSAPLDLENHLLKLHILVDQSSVEVFANDGKITMSTITFPAITQTGIELFTERGEAKLIDFKSWILASIWK